MAACMQYETVLVDLHETYSKQTFRNRFSILTSNGVHDLVVPVIKPNGNKTKTSEIIIKDDCNIFRQHLSALETAYGSSPYFEYFFDRITRFYSEKHENLAQMNFASVECVSEILRTRFDMRFTDNFIEAENCDCDDLRFAISPKNKLFTSFETPVYYQVFNTKFSFVSGLSVLDLLFNTGLETIQYLREFPLDSFIQKILKPT